MRSVKLTAFAFALSLSAGTAAACTLEAGASCGDATKEKVVNVATTTAAKAECPALKNAALEAHALATCGDGAETRIVSTSTAADCASACSAKATQTIADAGADSRSVPGGGVEIVQTNTAGDAGQKVGYEIGDKIENFTLKQAQTGEKVSLKDLAGEKATVIIFWNNLCPWVEGGPHASGDRVREMVKEYADKGVNVIGIDPGVDKTEEDLIAYASTQPFPILINRESSMAARFNAGYTPHTFIMDSNWELVYKGGFDSGARRADNGDVVHWARNAVDEVLEGQSPSVAVTRGTGCTIKWAPGSRPST